MMNNDDFRSTEPDPHEFDLQCEDCCAPVEWCRCVREEEDGPGQPTDILEAPDVR